MKLSSSVETILTVITARHAAALEMAAIEAGLQSKMVISAVLRLAVVLVSR